MTDNLKRTQPEDPNKINVNQTWEVNYWTQKFNVTKEKLSAAVKAVGPMVVDVKRHLGIR